MSGIALLTAIAVISYLIKNSIWNNQWQITDAIDSAKKYSSNAFFISTLTTSIATIFTSKNTEVAVTKSIIAIIAISFFGFLIGYFKYSFRNKNQATIDKDDSLWEIALNEIEKNNKETATWAKSLSEAMGDSDKAKAIYLRRRVEVLKQK